MQHRFDCHRRRNRVVERPVYFSKVFTERRVVAKKVHTMHDLGEYRSRAHKILHIHIEIEHQSKGVMRDQRYHIFHTTEECLSLCVIVQQDSDVSCFIDLFTVSHSDTVSKLSTFSAADKPDIYSRANILQYLDKSFILMRNIAMLGSSSWMRRKNPRSHR